MDPQIGVRIPDAQPNLEEHVKKIVAALVAVVMATTMTVATAGSSPWSGPIRLPWYGSDYYGKPVACPGYGKYTRWSVSVAVRPSDPRFKCGDKVELRFGKQTVIATVTDRFAEWAPSWVVFDASAAIACNHLNPPKLKPRKAGKYHTCFTRDNVYWRKIKGR